MRVALIGAGGRMGRAVRELSLAAGDELVWQGSGRDGVFEGLAAAGADVAIDFSSPWSFEPLLRVCVAARLPLVSGTTGLAQEALGALDAAAETLPVLWEPNLSIGVHVLCALVAQAAAQLGAGFDIEIVEAHHRDKRDAPSGTALRLVEAVHGVRPALRAQAGRSGRDSQRAPDEIGVHAVRGGRVVGEHTVGFYGEAEQLLLSHRAEQREVFAHGALRAARFVATQAPGRYRLRDVLAAG